jgi:hypothetical protein
MEPTGRPDYSKLEQVYPLNSKAGLRTPSKEKFGDGRSTFMDTSKNRKVVASPEPDAFVHPVQRWMDKRQTYMGSQFTKRRTFLFFILLAWVTVLWTSIIYKETTTDISDVMKYFTNVTFFLQAVFYTVYLLIFFEDPSKRKLETVVLVWFFWPVFAQISIVFILVIGVMKDAPQLLTANMKSLGGDYDDGDVLVFNFLFHVIPVIVVFIFMFINWGDISDCCILTFGYYDLSSDVSKDARIATLDNALSNDKILYVKISKGVQYGYILSQYFIASVIFVLYMLVVDLHKQYGISPSLATWIPIIAILGINVFAIGATNGFMFCSTIPNKFILKSQIESSDIAQMLPVDSFAHPVHALRVPADAPSVHLWPM